MYEDIFAEIRRQAEKKNLRESTINAYCYNVGLFLRTVDKDVSELTVDDVEAFLTEKRLSGIAPQTYNHYYSSIHFFYKKILKQNWDIDDLPRMKLDHTLPTVLTREEIDRIIACTSNLKHKAIIATMYASGLRVSEAVHLHYDDISRSGKSIHVRNTKSRRDRYTILSDRALDILTEYWFECGRPRDILFPNRTTGNYLSPNSINQFFKKSAEKAGITRRVTTHSCRHSFATHLLEDGTSIKYIQVLLGHIDPSSTEVYLHVSNKALLGIRSPFDNTAGGGS